MAAKGGRQLRPHVDVQRSSCRSRSQSFVQQNVVSLFHSISPSSCKNQKFFIIGYVPKRLIGFRAIAGAIQIVEKASMGILQIAFIVGLAGQSTSAGAQTTPAASVPIKRQLSGVTAREATDLIAKLEDAQRLLKAGKFQSFELLAGSIASYDTTKVSPREAFLQVPFRSVWNVERIHSDNKLAQPYRLAYAPSGLGKSYWDIEVVLDIDNDIDRVSMTYRPPAPF